MGESGRLRRTIADLWNSSGVAGLVLLAAACSTSAEQTGQANAELCETAPKLTSSVLAPQSPGDARWGVRLTNEGRTTCTIVRPGDASDMGWRQPHIAWVVETLEGEVVSESAHARCGNFNSLTLEDFVDLAPGESRDFFDWIGEPEVWQAGRYRVALRWEFDPNARWAHGGFRGADHDQLSPRLRALPPLHLCSEFLEIDLAGS